MKLRLAIAALATLFVLLQGQLWVSNDGFREVFRLENLISRQHEENRALAQRNQRLEADVRELKLGAAAVEERARIDLGLVGQGETFYIFSEPAGSAGSDGAPAPD